jgi:hypothetical protein
MARLSTWNNSPVHTLLWRLLATEHMSQRAHDEIEQTKKKRNHTVDQFGTRGVYQLLSLSACDFPGFFPLEIIISCDIQKEPPSQVSL